LPARAGAPARARVTAAPTAKVAVVRLFTMGVPPDADVIVPDHSSGKPTATVEIGDFVR
jgi:hypothetical protein